MATKRMFSKEVVLTDWFLDMPMSARCLYFTLSMVADDDGFVDNPRAIMRQCGASLDDMKLLLTKYFLIEFETGVIVITHWRMNNYLRGDRYHPTKHTTEYSMLEVNDNKPYVLKDNSNTPNIYNTKSLDLVPDGIPSGIPSGIPKTNQSENTPTNDSYSDRIKEILDYLNQKTGKHYTTRSKASVKMIRERLREGYTVDEFKAVIQNKVNAWLHDSEWNKYLRPETLFCAKHFDSYLNDVEDEKQKRKREDAEINERQREAIRKSCEIGLY